MLNRVIFFLTLLFPLLFSPVSHSQSPNIKKQGWTKTAGLGSRYWDGTVKSTMPGGPTLLKHSSSLAGAQFGMFQMEDKLLFSLDFGIYIGQGAGKDYTPLETSHFLRKDNFALFTTDISYHYAVTSFLSFGPSAAIELPMDPNYLLANAFIGGTFVGAAMEARLNHRNFGLVISTSRGFQIVSSDKTQLTTASNRVGVFYIF